MAEYTENYNLSMPEQTDTQADFIQAYRENMGIIDENMGGGGGGAEIVEMTQAEYDALPDTKLTDNVLRAIKDVNSLSELATMDINGVFIDTNNVIKSATTVSPNTTATYTATQDCIIKVSLGRSNNSAPQFAINGVIAFRYSSNDSVFSSVIDMFYVKKDDVITITSGNENCAYVVYGLQPASNVVIIPDYLSSCYSTTERQIGCWTDGKPLYQRTWIVPKSSLSSGESTYTHNADLHIDTLVGVRGTVANSRPLVEYHTSGEWACSIYNIGNNAFWIYLGSSVYSNMSSSSTVKVTLQYTKTTDTPGSGTWTPTGTPTVHYTTDEQVIGTWMGRPLYEKVVVCPQMTFTQDTWTQTTIAKGDMATLVDVWLVIDDSVPSVHKGMSGGFVSGYLAINMFRTTAITTDNAYIVLQYTKS